MFRSFEEVLGVAGITAICQANFLDEEETAAVFKVLELVDRQRGQGGCGHVIIGCTESFLMAKIMTALTQIQAAFILAQESEVVEASEADLN